MTAEQIINDKVYPVPNRLLKGGLPKPFVSSFDEYKAKWEESVNDPTKFFGNVSSYIHHLYYSILIIYIYFTTACE
jgi:acetyl-CoA synthetase